MRQRGSCEPRNGFWCDCLRQLFWRTWKINIIMFNKSTAPRFNSFILNLEDNNISHLRSLWVVWVKFYDCDYSSISGSVYTILIDGTVCALNQFYQFVQGVISKGKLLVKQNKHASGTKSLIESSSPKNQTSAYTYCISIYKQGVQGIYIR